MARIAGRVDLLCVAHAADAAAVLRGAFPDEGLFLADADADADAAADGAARCDDAAVFTAPGDGLFE